MRTSLPKAFVDYHRGLGKMPWRWKPWLFALLFANMIQPLFLLQHWEARLVFATALVHGAIFVVLTAMTGFSRLLGLGHIFWFPLVYVLWLQLDSHPPDTVSGVWIRAVIVLDAGSLVLDVANVIRYLRGDHEEMVVMD